MQIYSRLKEYYRYQRNWRKLQRRQCTIREKKHLAEELNFYSQLVKKGDLCFDIGANIGDKTSLLLQLGAIVVAVEPQESCWRVLERRFRNERVFIESVALDSREGSSTIFIDRSHTLATMSQDWINTVRQSGRFPGHRWDNKTTVQTTTLDVLIEKYGKPVFCKMDVEGAEFEVLQGLSQAIGAISLEFVSERLEASMHCIDHLSGLGKPEFNYCLGGSMAFALPDWVDSGQVKSILRAMDSDVENYGDLYARFRGE